jgi:hypothetical protein
MRFAPESRLTSGSVLLQSAWVLQKITLPTQWELWLKTLTLIGGIGAAIWAYVTYADTKQKEFYTEYWNRKFALFEETSKAASTLATTSSAEEFCKARELYFELFFGRLSLVEGDRVKEAMQKFAGLIPTGDPPMPVQSLEQPAYKLTIELKRELSESWKKPFSELHQGVYQGSPTPAPKSTPDVSK